MTICRDHWHLNQERIKIKLKEFDCTSECHQDKLCDNRCLSNMQRLFRSPEYVQLESRAIAALCLALYKGNEIEGCVTPGDEQQYVYMMLVLND